MAEICDYNTSDAMRRPRRIYTDGVTMPGSTPGVEGDWSTGYYSYDGSGNLMTLTAHPPLKTGTDYYVYDKVSRLTSGSLSIGGTTCSQTYAFDPYGNMTSYNGTSLPILGTRIFINPAFLPQAFGGVPKTAATSLVHEVGHALGMLFRAQALKVNDLYMPGVRYKGEGYPMTFENRYRSEVGLPLREYYIQPRDYTDPGDVSLFP